MTRLGWGLLAAFIAIGGLFASTVSFRTQIAPSTTRQSLPPAAANAGGGTLIVPVDGVHRAAIVDTWGQSRDDGERAHQGTDIPAPRGTIVRAAAPGRVDKLFDSAAGGTTLYIRSPDGRLTYYYAHLAGYAPGVREGLAVRAGQPIAFVGDTGNAGQGNTHLHFGVTRTEPGDRWWEGDAINPYPMLAGTGAGS